MYSEEECREYIKKLNNEYKDKHIRSQERDELIFENNIEKRDIKGYHGREILELLQNADDAYQKSINFGEMPNSKLDVKITYKKNILTISNTGTYFDYEGIKAIVQGNNSSKKGKYIGSKGTGFRSILNWAKEIRIYSGNFKLKFSSDVSKHFFDSIKNEPQIKKQLNKNKNLYIPILSYPEYISNTEEYLSTTIEIVVDKQKILDDFNVDKQLKNIDSKILLFLPNTNSITIETEMNCTKFERERVNEDKVNSKNQEFVDSMSLITISKKINDEIVQTEEYDLFERTIKDKFEEDGEKKEVNLAIAIPTDNQNYENLHLYTFFPLLETSSPFNCVMHATYELGDQRNTISMGNQINKEIIKEQINFIFDIAEQYYIETKQHQKALDILFPRNLNESSSFYNFKFQHGFLNFDVEDYYIEKLKNIKMFLTVNKEVISFKDNPIIIDNDFPNFITGDMFNKLLDKSICAKAKEIIKLIKNRSMLISSNEYKECELCDKISQLSNKLNAKERVICYDWWEQNYKNYLPNLLIDQNKNWITKDSECYFLDGNFDDIEIPSWINIPSIDKDYQKELFEIVKNKKEILEDLSAGMPISRIISTKKIYSLIDFKYRDKSTIISALNSSIDSYEKSVDFVKWLWKYYGDDENWIPPQNIKYHFPSSEKETEDSSLLYLGKEYNKFLSEKIFTNTSYSAIAPPGLIYQGSEENKDKFVEFLKKFGVLEFPKICDKERSYDQEFKNHIMTKYNYQNNINYLFVKNIDNLKKILEKLTTKEIVQWFNEDVDLDNLIKSNEKNGYYKNKSNSTPYYIYSNEYVLYILNNTKWIEINNVKYSPNQIIKFSKLEDKIFGYYGISENALISVLGENIVSNYKLDFVDSMAQLPDNIIKKFLIELPNVDNTGEISKKLYEDIIKTKYPDDEPSFDTSDIKVFCFDEKFHLNSDVKYASRKVQKNTNIESKLIFIQPKRNSEIIKNWLGVEKYKTSLILNEYEKIDNNEFAQEINNLKVAFLASINETNNFISKLKQLKIIPCAYIEASDTETNTSIKMDNYNYIKDKGTYFIKIPSNCDKLQLQQSIDFGNSVIEIFKDFVTPQIDENLFGRLISTNSENRKRIIDEQFGFNRWSYAEELFSNQKEINEIILNFFMENELSENNLTLLKTIDFSKSLSDNNYNNLKVSLYEIGKDIRDLNKINSGINIDIKDNIKNEFDKYKDLKFENFEKSLYVLLKDKIDKQNEFLNICNQYKCFQIKNIENSININIENLYNKFLKNNFDNIKFTSQEDIDIKKIYNDNYKICIEGIATNEKDFEFFLEKNQNIKSLLYFCVPDNIKQLFEEFDSEVNKKENPNTIQEEYQTKTINTTLEERNISKNINSKIKSEASQKQYEKQAENNERIGKKAEEIAYLELKKSFPNIKWHSKNSSFPADKNDAPVGVTCDMWNIDEYGKKTYFEIKSSINEFEMSIHEYNSMKNFQNDYEVVLVDVKNNTISRHRFKELEPLKQISKYSFVFKQIEN